MKRLALVLSVCLMLLTVQINTVIASDASIATKDRAAIVVASFGTTVPSAVGSITNIVERIRKAYPETEVRLTFTSNIIRSIWRERQAEPKKWLDQGIPEEVLFVENIISVVGDLNEEGYKNILVAPTHMFYMEQSHDLNSYVRGLSSIRAMKQKWTPFEQIAMARPALGMPGTVFDYHEDVTAAAKTLAGDVEKAKKMGAALVYMGHGNEHWSTGIYDETAKEMNKMYPEVKTFVGVVEGSPKVEEVIVDLKAAGVKKVLLKSFMIVAGDHAVNDMASDEEDSWKTILTKEGFEVEVMLDGLGSNDKFADIFVKHIADTAKLRHLKLK